VTHSRKAEIALACALAIFSFTTARANTEPSQSAQPPQATQGAKSAQTKSSPDSDGDEGEKRFQSHCGRCHNPPEDLNPRTVKAVVRQMRVRAMLTDEDERLIVKYLAP
jgi:mono/diheme cytochrome c family protein